MHCVCLILYCACMKLYSPKQKPKTGESIIHLCEQVCSNNDFATCIEHIVDFRGVSLLYTTESGRDLPAICNDNNMPWITLHVPCSIIETENLV